MVKNRTSSGQISTIGLCFIGVAALYIVFLAERHERLEHLAQTHVDVRAESTDHSTKHALTLEASNVKTKDPQCRVEFHQEYHGDMLKWGDQNLQESWEACCGSCKSTPQCNAWVYCGNPGGCGSRPFKECWLKKADLAEIHENVLGKNHSGIPWTSGLVYSEEEALRLARIKEERLQKEADRKKRLRDDESLPLVFMDVALDGKTIGRIEAVLFMKDSPLAAENMRVFCSGEKGAPWLLKGAYFYRIIDRFIDQTGVHGASSIYNKQFADDPGGLLLKHDRPYLLSIANSGHNTNTAHFSITVAPAHHLDGSYVIFGECVSGFDVIEAVNALSRGRTKNELLDSRRAQIVETGQLRRGTYIPPPQAP